MSYRAFTRLTDAARRTELWRLALGILVVATITYGLGQSLVALVALGMGDEAFLGFARDLMAGQTPASMCVLLLSVGALSVGTVVTAQFVHGRTARGLFGPSRPFLHQFFRVLLFVGVLQTVLIALPFAPAGTELEPGMPLGRWLVLLPLTLSALLIQTGSEELFFRGYLQSQLAARLPYPLVWLTLPSALFALGHFAPSVYGGNAVYVTLWAFAFGVAAADLTARAGTLAPAIALHLVNNLVPVALVAPPGNMSGLALYLLPFDVTDEAAVLAMLPFDLIGILLCWLAARIAIRA
ncbi:CPBP family intramembrane glutamic endopeptidase [Salipiger sp.]|uniref:CPBP family intramembrane glutamic endopeptidase n=1 Tax=Salipiger sp. TaxID=2078585 RepID=UPI003A97A8E6